MPITPKPINITVDLTRPGIVNTQKEMRYGDKNLLTVEVTRGGEVIDLATIGAVTTDLVVKRLGSTNKDVVGNIVDGKAVFTVDGDSLAKPGRTEAVIQFYDADGARISTATFAFTTLADPSLTAVGDVVEQTIIQQVLIDGPQVIANAEEKILELDTVIDQNYFNFIGDVATRSAIPVESEREFGDAWFVIDEGATVRWNGTALELRNTNNPSQIQNLSVQLADMAQKTLGYGTKSQRPANPEVADLFFLTDKKKRIEYNGEKWQYFDGEPVDVLEIVDGNLYPNYSFTPQSGATNSAIPIRSNTGIDMTKDFILYSRLKLADNNDFAHFSFKIGAAYQLQLTFGYNWVTAAKDGASISIYDYLDTSKTLLGSVDFYTTAHDIVVWYDHKWGYLNVYVDNVLIGSWKPQSGGASLSATDLVIMEVGSGSTLITLDYIYMATPLMTTIGDSIMGGAIKHAPDPTRYAGVDDYNNSYPKHISDYLRTNGIKNYFVANKGVNSDTTTGMLARFVTDVVNTGCKYCIIEGGINDYPSNDPSATVARKLQMADTSVANGIEPLLLGVIPTKSTSVSTSHQFAKDLHLLENQSYGKYAYADIWGAIEGLTTGVADNAKMDDTVHPNLLGYIAMADDSKPLIKIL